MSTEEGLKLDSGKQEYYAMPLVIAKLLADVFAAGEKKYETFNCLKPFKDSARRFYNGAMRHTEESQLNPLAIDPETGTYHGAQAAWNHLLRVYHALEEEKRGNKIITDPNQERSNIDFCAEPCTKCTQP